MVAQKYELARIIDRIKGVVQKNAVFPALEGILVRDGCFTGSNTELTVQVISGACRGDCFIIPMKAFDMIKNLPDGEVEIRAEGDNQILVKTDRIKNRYHTFSPDDYVFYKADADYDNEFTLPGEMLMEALGRVVYASSEKEAMAILGGVYFEAEAGALNLVATDGHVLAWDRIDTDGESEMKAIVPKSAVKKLLSLGIVDSLSVSYNQNSIIFRSGDVVVSSRLINGNYVEYKKFFRDAPETASISRKGLLEAMGRAKLCMAEKDDARRPAVFHFAGGELQVSIADSLSDYSEEIELNSLLSGETRIGLNPNIVMDTLRVIGSAEASLSFTDARNPLYFADPCSQFRAMVLPVVLNG